MFISLWVIGVFAVLGVLFIAFDAFYVAKFKFQRDKAVRDADEAKRKLEEVTPRIKSEQSKVWERHWRTEFAKKFADRLATLKQKLAASHAQTVNREQVGAEVGDIIAWMKNRIDERYQRLGQDFHADVLEAAEDITSNLQEVISDKVWRAFQQYKEAVQDEPLLLPQNTRLAYTKGGRTIILVEQPPTVRSLSFTQKVVNGGSQSTSTPRGFRRYNLAFPFVYFFMTFDNQRCVNFSVFISPKPIGGKNSEVYPLPLPNVWRDKGDLYYPMCMGEGFWEGMKSTDVISQAERLVSHFWQRTFNGHLGHGGYFNADDRLKTLRDWEFNSQKDPLFVLTVPWRDGRNIGTLVDAMLDWRKMKSPLDGSDKALRTLLDGSAASVGEQIKGKIEHVQQSIQTGDLQLSNELEQKLEHVFAEHVPTLFDRISQEVIKADAPASSSALKK